MTDPNETEAMQWLRRWPNIFDIDRLGNLRGGYNAFIGHYEARKDFLLAFSFAILDQHTVTQLLPYAPLLEVGSGSGYWAYELRKAGADIVATDLEPGNENESGSPSNGSRSSRSPPSRPSTSIRIERYSQEKDIHGPEEEATEWEMYLDEIFSYDPELAASEAAYEERMAA
jgi:hypothetical protein